ncbi:response regulator transcription factor [Chryseobacterium limigenitum]|nr:response regulator transcription factor [Chryseobacterium limigenitum]
MLQDLSIAIVDDHVLFAESLKVLLQTQMPYKSEVYIYNNLKDLQAELDNDKHFDFLLLDIQIGSENGLIFLGKTPLLLKKAKNIIILSSLGNSLMIKQAIESGAKGFLSKNCDVNELERAFTKTSNGQIYVSEIFEKELAEHAINKITVPSLTTREAEVLSYLCAAYTVKEIASKMEISTHTVQMYVKNLFNKFKINRTTDLVLYATKNGLNLPLN